MHHTSPNPFYPGTDISFQVIDQMPVVLEIFDLNGNPVKKFVDNTLSIGWHCIEWDATDDDGKVVPAGIYFYRISSERFVKTHRLILTPFS